MVQELIIKKNRIMKIKTAREFICEKYGLNAKVEMYRNYHEIVNQINRLESRIHDCNNHPNNSFFIGVKLASQQKIKDLKSVLKKQV